MPSHAGDHPAPRFFQFIQFAEFSMHVQTGELCEIDAQLYEHFRQIKPAPFVNAVFTMAGGRRRRCDFATAEGHEYLTAFWRQDGRYFAQLTQILNPYA